MARPPRRVIINLACALHLDYRVVEQWDLTTVREHMVMLKVMSGGTFVKQPDQDSEAAIESRFESYFDHKPPPKG